MGLGQIKEFFSYKEIFYKRFLYSDNNLLKFVARNVVVVIFSVGSERGETNSRTTNP